MITQKYREGDTWWDGENGRKIVKRTKFDIYYEEIVKVQKYAIDTFSAHVRHHNLTLKK